MFKKLVRSLKWLFIFGVPILLIFLISYGAYLYHTVENILTQSHQDIERENKKSRLRSYSVDPIKDNISILFIGIDTGEERDYHEASRSDALLLATFNKEDKSIKLLSIPRDTIVYVPEIDRTTKINHAHFYGGPRSTIETIENFLHIPIDYYVRVNFEAFINVVEALDGIPYNVPYEIRELDSHDNKNAVHLFPGYQTLSGEEALALVRSRKYDNDIERGKRQQDIMKQIAKKSTSLPNLFKIDDIIRAVGTNLKTNLTFQEIRTLFHYGIEYPYTIDTINFEGDSGYGEDGLWYYNVREDSKWKIANELRHHLNLPEDGRNPSKFAGEDD
ncbi:LCP family protein [Ornithinibacillus bavariensis]|uniref:LCP family protein n=1 Tax=Ornithinibacillus bavariensis TaxID=545502 RepID=UPI000EBE3221|nr:transcriptional regulator [Ornithinibacillus sp.]